MLGRQLRIIFTISEGASYFFYYYDVRWVQVLETIKQIIKTVAG